MSAGGRLIAGVGVVTAIAHEAVVVIHGIGEQRPLDTLRSFVRGRSTSEIDSPIDLGGVALPQDRAYPGAAPLTGRLYERRYSVVWEHGQVPEALAMGPDHTDAAEHSTDCYEFYWAYRYRDSTVGQLLSFFVPLLRRRRSSFLSPKILGHDGSPEGLRANRAWRALVFVLTTGSVLMAALLVAHELGAASWISAVPVVAVSVLLGLGGLLVALGCGILSTIRTALVLVAAWSVAIGASVTGHSVDLSWLKGSAAGTVTALIGSLVVATLVRSLGDVARYLGASPDSVEPTDELLAGVVRFLEALHDDTDEDTGAARYDRIVVVGHSLGSVIAYDAVRALWARRAAALRLAPETVTAVAELERLALDRDVAGRPRVRVIDFPSAAFRQTQGRILDELRAVPPDGRPTGRWIITDLVTMGSPLAHADALLAQSTEDLDARIVDGRVVTAPPQPRRTPSDHPYRRERARCHLWLPREKFATLPENAVFAVVHWTNVYFNHDIVGGPVAPLFGPAVVDVPLGTSGWLGRFLWRRQYPHSSYWTLSADRYLRPLSKASVEVLRTIIRPRPVLVLTSRDGWGQGLDVMVDGWIAEQLRREHPQGDPGPLVEVMVHDTGGRRYRTTHLDIRVGAADVLDLADGLGPDVDVCLSVSSPDPERIREMNGEPRHETETETERLHHDEPRDLQQDDGTPPWPPRDRHWTSDQEVEPAPSDDSERVG